jgi:hypothetical protein
MPDQPSPRRRFQFSLREVLLLFTVIAFAIAWGRERWRRSDDLTVNQAAEMMKKDNLHELRVIDEEEQGRWYRYTLRREEIKP